MVPILHRFRCPAITTAAAAKVEVDSRAVMSMGLCKVFDTLSNGDSFGLVGTFYKEKVLVGAGHCENPVDTFSERDVLSCGNMGNIRPAIR